MYPTWFPFLAVVLLLILQPSFPYLYSVICFTLLLHFLRWHSIHHKKIDTLCYNISYAYYIGIPLHHVSLPVTVLIFILFHFSKFSVMCYWRLVSQGSF